MKCDDTHHLNPKGNVAGLFLELPSGHVMFTCTHYETCASTVLRLLHLVLTKS